MKLDDFELHYEKLPGDKRRIKEILHFDKPSRVVAYVRQFLRRHNIIKSNRRVK